MSSSRFIAAKENLLFQSWKTSRQGFVPDGVVSEDDYLASSPSIVFILKEVNDPSGGGWDLREFLRNGGRADTWDNVARWVHGIRNLGDDDDWPSQYETISNEFRVDVLRSICVINLKKSPGTHTTEKASLTAVAKEDAPRIRSQYAIYDPDLTICGGTADLFRTVFCHERLEWRQTRRGIWWYQRAPEKIVIAYAHPKARVQASLLHYGLIDTVSELLGYQKGQRDS